MANSLTNRFRLHNGYKKHIYLPPTFQNNFVKALGKATMTDPIPEPRLPITSAFIDTANSQPDADHADAWPPAKEELNAFSNSYRERFYEHEEHKTATLKAWKAKAGMLEKKRLSCLDSNADEHDYMFAAGVPGHIMLEFRQKDEVLRNDRQLMSEKIRLCRDLGFQFNREDSGQRGKQAA